MISIQFVFVQYLELVFQVRWEFWSRLQQEGFIKKNFNKSQLKKNTLPEDEEEEEEFTSPFLREI